MNYKNNPLSFKKYLDTAICASVESGKAIMKIYRKKIQVDFKNDQSPITSADLISNRIILKELSKTNIPIISEESKKTIYSERKKWELCWVVDPIDGTKEFIKQNGEFTVNICLIKKGVPLLGVIFVPAKGELYYTDEFKQFAYKSYIKDNFDGDYIDNLLFKESEKINPSFGQINTLRIVGSRSHMNQETFNYVNEQKKKYENVEIVSVGSSLKFCMVAEGKADVYPRYAPTMEWDTAAGQAICEAVGLRVIDKKTQKPIRYNRKELLNNYFLVSK